MRARGREGRDIFCRQAVLVHLCLPGGLCGTVCVGVHIGIVCVLMQGPRSTSWLVSIV